MARSELLSNETLLHPSGAAVALFTTVKHGSSSSCFYAGGG